MIPFSPPRIDEKIIAEVTNALKSGWITTGPKTALFETNIETYTGAKSAVCLNSATAGLELVLRWFGVKPGDEVILPAYTYCATANVVMHIGATPVLVDCEKDKFTIDCQNVKDAITAKTKVIMPVDIAGNLCDYEALNKLVCAKDVNDKFVAESEPQKQLGRILILADAAHSFGAVSNQIFQGALTDVAVFSFHAVKNLTTAEGGAVCFNLPDTLDNVAIKAYFKKMSLHGQSKDALAKLQPGAWRYDVAEPGYKCNMTDISAAIGLVELDRYEQETLPRRKQICERYSHAFEGNASFRVPQFGGVNERSSFHLYQLRINHANEEQRDAIIKRISENGVSVNVHFLPLPLLSFYKNFGFEMSRYPNAFDQYKNEISLPVFYDLTQAEQQHVIDVVKESTMEVMHG